MYKQRNTGCNDCQRRQAQYQKRMRDLQEENRNLKELLSRTNTFPQKEQAFHPTLGPLKRKQPIVTHERTQDFQRICDNEVYMTGTIKSILKSKKQVDSSHTIPKNSQQQIQTRKQLTHFPCESQSLIKQQVILEKRNRQYQRGDSPNNKQALDKDSESRRRVEEIDEFQRHSSITELSSSQMPVVNSKYEAEHDFEHTPINSIKRFMGNNDNRGSCEEIIEQIEEVTPQSFTKKEPVSEHSIDVNQQIANEVSSFMKGIETKLQLKAKQQQSKIQEISFQVSNKSLMRNRYLDENQILQQTLKEQVPGQDNSRPVASQKSETKLSEKSSHTNCHNRVRSECTNLVYLGSENQDENIISTESVRNSQAPFGLTHTNSKFTKDYLRNKYPVKPNTEHQLNFLQPKVYTESWKVFTTKAVYDTEKKNNKIRNNPYIK